MPHPGHNLNASITTLPTASASATTPASAPAPTPTPASAIPNPMTATTSSFKATPLLPMPTLEDIECGHGSGSGSAGDGGRMLAVNNPLLPPGILKYSSSTPAYATIAATTGAPTMPALPGASLLRTSSASASASASSTATVSPTQAVATDACGPLKSNNKLLAVVSGTQQQTLPLPPRSSAGFLSTSSTIASNLTGGSNSNYCSTSAINNAVGGGGGGGGLGSSNNRRHKTRRKCCACFGAAGRGQEETDSGGEGRPAASSQKYAAAPKKAKKTQTLWAGLLTNLGIWALLLAYTLLGSFIFLTIENEDSSSLLLHQQRSMASTKRVPGGVSVAGQSGSRQEDDSTGEMYHTPTHHLVNGTAAAISSSASFSSAQSSTLPLSASSSMSVSASASASASEDTSAMNDNHNHEFGFSDSQLALSADTYDVRQRTIENIWDITVSLNILYKENWTKLAALEIAKFQDQLVKRLNEDTLLQLAHDSDAGASVGGNSPATEAVLLLSHQHGQHSQHYEWNFAKAFLYSLTVLTTIGYGNIAPKTTLGRLVTLVYAILGIPLTLVYLSSTGGLLAKVAREVFSKALCCCLCSNCGYCCYDEKRMAEKERRTKRKRQQEELRKQQAAMPEPYYVRSSSLHSNFHSPEKHTASSTGMMPPGATIPDMDSLSASESRGSMHGLSILAPILLCLSMMLIYIMFGAVVLYKLEDWPLLDGVYFCFMSLSTIGFGDLVPGLLKESTTTTWFCSVYIMAGMALTAMCFNVIHEEIVHRIKIVVEFKKGSALDSMNDEQSYYMAPPQT